MDKGHTHREGHSDTKQTDTRSSPAPDAGEERENRHEPAAGKGASHAAAHGKAEKAAREPTEAVESTAAGDEAAQLRASLETKSAECDKYRDSLLRLQAEFENYRKRMVREQTQFLERAVEGFVSKLLPIIDNLERAIAAAEEKHDLEQLAGGVTMVHSQIVDLFAREGIEIIDPVEQPFDPTLHHAMLTVEDDEHEDNTVLEVLQKGYVLKGKVIRPAMVKVSKRPER